MSGVVDWGKYMLSKDRLSKDFNFKTGIPRLSVKGSLERTGEDMDRLFVGAPEKPEAPEAPGKTLKSAESREELARSQDEVRRRRVASMGASQPLGRKSVLGG